MKPHGKINFNIFKPFIQIKQIIKSVRTVRLRALVCCVGR